jgi:hypothetical protein
MAGCCRSGLLGGGRDDGAASEADAEVVLSGDNDDDGDGDGDEDAAVLEVA